MTLVFLFLCCLIIPMYAASRQYDEMLISRIDHDLQTLRHRIRYQDEQYISPSKTQYKVGTTYKQGSTYVRWGSSRCPQQSTLVYQGYAGGKKWNVNGGGSNFLCLTKNPEYTNLTSPNMANNMYGVETDIHGFSPSIADKDLSCAVCFTSSVTLMVPGQKSCPDDWKVQYWGYLMSHGAGGSWQPTQNICVDNNPTAVPGGDANNGQSVVYLVGGMCGSLKCPPYVNGKPLTCAVCSR